MYSGSLNTGLCTDNGWLVGVSGGQLISHSILLLGDFTLTLGRLLPSCPFASPLSQSSASSLPYPIPNALLLLYFWDRKLLWFVLRPIVCLGLCGGGTWSWDTCGREEEVCTQAASHDLRYNVDVLISIRNETTFSNVDAIPSTQAECYRQDQSLPEIRLLKKCTDCFRNRSLPLDSKILRSDSGRFLRKHNQNLARQKCRSW